MTRIKFCAALIVALLGQSELAEAQVTTTTANEITPIDRETQVTMDYFAFGMTSEDYGRRIKRLRFTGWSMLSVGLTLGIVGPIVSARTAPDEFLAAWPGMISTATVGGVIFIAGAFCLMTARIKVGQRRRFRERYPGVDQRALTLEMGPGRVVVGLPF